MQKLKNALNRINMKYTLSNTDPNINKYYLKSCTLKDQSLLSSYQPLPLAE